jgi:hypothetical protein
MSGEMTAMSFMVRGIRGNVFIYEWQTIKWSDVL